MPLFTANRRWALYDTHCKPRCFGKEAGADRRRENGPRNPRQRFQVTLYFWPFVVLCSQHLEQYNKSMKRVRSLCEAQYPSVWSLILYNGSIGWPLCVAWKRILTPVFDQVSNLRKSKSPYKGPEPG